MDNKLSEALDGFMHRYCQSSNAVLLTHFDDDFLSECIQSEPDSDGLVRWLPVKQHQLNTFENLEQALEIELDPQIQTFFGRYWSDHLNAEASDGQLTLLQVWNQDDFERLQQNMIGHIMMKRRLKQPESLFFGLTDQEDIILCIDNATGQVVVEQIGKRFHKVLAASLAEFLTQIRPLPHLSTP